MILETSIVISHPSYDMISYTCLIRVQEADTVSQESSAPEAQKCTKLSVPPNVMTSLCEAIKMARWGRSGSTRLWGTITERFVGDGTFQGIPDSVRLAQPTCSGGTHVP